MIECESDMIEWFGDRIRLKRGMGMGALAALGAGYVYYDY